MKQIKNIIQTYLLSVTKVLPLISCDQSFESELNNEEIVSLSQIDNVVSIDMVQKFYSMVKLVDKTITNKN